MYLTEVYHDKGSKSQVLSLALEHFEGQSNCLTMPQRWFPDVNHKLCASNLKNVKLHPDTTSTLGPNDLQLPPATLQCEVTPVVDWFMI